MTLQQPALLTIIVGCAMLIASCSTSPQGGPRRSKQAFGSVDGKDVSIYTLRNKNGMEARITNYGGIVVSLMVPDRSGKLADVVLGYDSLSPYLTQTSYFGALVGRVANRIGHARFALEGKEYVLAANDGPNHLHGGLRGFNRAVWEVDESTPPSEPTLVLSYLSKDGEEGYPGTLRVKVVYSLSDSNDLRIDYTATTDKPTVLNLTHHSYFNLAGQGVGDILNETVMINADRFTPIDSALIPTGEIRPVQETPMDFRTPHKVGDRINEKDDQLRLGRGYDHNWVLNRSGDGLSFAARVSEPTSGRIMEVWTTEPAIQLYTGNFLDGKSIGKGGVAYKYRTGLCLETQHFPDSPNRPEFPSCVLRPGETFTSSTIYRFSAQ